MAKCWSDASEQIIRWKHSGDEPDATPGAVESLEFDETTNRATADGLDASGMVGWTLAGGVLRRSGVPVAINPPSTTIRDQLREVAKQVFTASSQDKTGYAKAFRALSLVFMDEINLLREAAALPARTVTQVKAAVRDKIDGGGADD